MKIVCIGDSITWGFPWGPDVSWVRKLEETLGIEVINKGINGNTTSDMLRRFDAAVLKNEPSHVIITGGANDVLCAESFDRITANLRSMAETAQAHGIKVILGLPIAIDDIYLEGLLARVRDWINKYAAAEHVKVIPFNRGFYDENGKIRDDLLLMDGAHPTAAGYEEMFKQINLNIFK